MKYLPKWHVIVLAASAMLWIGCVPRVSVIPSAMVPHQLAAPIKDAEIFVELPNGKKRVEKVDIPAFWWVAGPPVVEEEVKHNAVQGKEEGR